MNGWLDNRCEKPRKKEKIDGFMKILYIYIKKKIGVPKFLVPEAAASSASP